jgi:predicted nucleic acid-binding Zn ribbon protein
MVDDPLKVCEVCGRPVERVLHSPAVHFKGSGFYNTDYGTRKRQRETKNAAESGAEKTEAKAAEKKADAGKADAPKSDSKPSKSSEKSS